MIEGVNKDVCNNIKNKLLETRQNVSTEFRDGLFNIEKRDREPLDAALEVVKLEALRWLDKNSQAHQLIEKVNKLPPHLYNDLRDDLPYTSQQVIEHLTEYVTQRFKDDKEACARATDVVMDILKTDASRTLAFEYYDFFKSLPNNKRDVRANWELAELASTILVAAVHVSIDARDKNLELESFDKMQDDFERLISINMSQSLKIEPGSLEDIMFKNFNSQMIKFRAKPLSEMIIFAGKEIYGRLLEDN
jgi:hypothetical protein